MGNREGYPPPQSTRGLGEHRKLPSGVWGRTPAKTILLLSKRVRMGASKDLTSLGASNCTGRSMEQLNIKD